MSENSMLESRHRQIQEQFGQRAPIYEERAAWIPDEGILSTFVRLCQVPRESTLLDVCCGTGIVGGAFRGRVDRLVGLDLTREMLERAKERLDEVHQGSADALPFADNTFDCAIIRQALHFVESPAGVVAQMARVVRPGGQVIVGHRVPYGPLDAEWWARINRAKQPLIKNLLLAADLERFVKEAGLVDLELKELFVEESIRRWVDSPEAQGGGNDVFRFYQETPPEIREIRHIVVGEDEVRDTWRWVVISGRKPGAL